MSPHKSRFLRRTNTNGSMDSVCCECFVTVATARKEAELDGPEQSHRCDPMLLEHWKGMGQGKENEECKLAQRYGYSFALGLV
jgi:hypothetical protein